MSNPQNVNQRKNTQVTINPTTLAQNYNVALAQYAATTAANRNAATALANKNPVTGSTIKNTSASINKNPATALANKNVASASANKNTAASAANKSALTVAANKSPATASTNKSATTGSANKSVAATTPNKPVNTASTNKNGMDSTNLKARTIPPNTTVPASPSTQATTKTEAKTTTTTVSAASLAEKIKDDNLQRLTDTRSKVLKHYSSTLEDLKRNFQETITQLFFIQSGGNMVDYPAWKGRPTPHLVSYLTSQRLDDSKLVFPSVTSSGSSKTENVSLKKSIKQEPVDSIAMEKYGFVQGSHVAPHHKEKSSKHSHDSKSSLHTDSDKKPQLNASGHVVSQKTSSSGSTDIAGQVRHESETLHRIGELRKNGLWSASRLPKVFEIPRKKSHWDFLLEEMQWLATDFSQEKRWKRNMAKKLSRAVLKYHHDKGIQEKRLKREETARLRRIASGIAKEVKNFWQQIEKVASYKQQSRQEEQRRKALDLHLNFIVGQTEKYSSWLAEGMKESATASPASEYPESEMKEESDEEIDEEKEDEDYQDELDALKKEGEIPIEDLLDTLPESMLKRITGEANSDSETDVDDGGDYSEDSEDDSEEDVSDIESEDEQGDEEEQQQEEEEEETNVSMLQKKEEDLAEEDDGGEFVLRKCDEEKDDEETIAEEEKLQKDADYQSELDDLQKEGELPLEELLKLYGQPPPTPSDTGMESDDEDNTDIIKGDDTSKKEEKIVGVATTEELNNAAATAESLQPKGFTLSTTQVRTKIPHLLRGTLREYQHIGLDWLVTMYTKQLNGILADEMGLGKTIQTIALLAHLACEEETWGPHLIVVPTSVMLNWEFEIKKWCPAFKILTYFGSQKERKLKRTGWSKPNAFHVCITSYKLVIQDHQAFRRRKWRYLILDEAQNIKNFKSQRWQTLLNFHSQRRLLLTGTPLQNNLMELWSLMHFLMPNIFQSHQDFKEWFSNPLTGMIEGSREYNEGLVKRLHSVLRPFLLRRLKAEVELQMPKKYEHVIKCRLSKRQRFLYDEFMSRTKTKETLEAGNFLSVINILMQLRKVCNHPDLFELRPTVSPFVMDQLTVPLPSLVNKPLDYNPFTQIDLSSLNLCLSDLELKMTAFQAYRTQHLKVNRTLIQELDTHTPSLFKRTHSNITGSTEVKSLSNISEGKPTVIAESEEKRNLFDVLKNSCADDGNTSQDSEVSDAECVDVEKTKDGSSSEGPPAKRAKIELEAGVSKDDADAEGEVQEVVINDGKRLLDRFQESESTEFTLDTMSERVKAYQKGRFDLLATMNERHCEATPVYGADLIDCMKIVPTSCRTTMARFTGALSHQTPRQKLCDCLCDVIKLPKTRVRERQGITNRYSLYTHRMVASPIKMRTTNSIPYNERREDNLSKSLVVSTRGTNDVYHSIGIQKMLQFPETRLVQYDCGKLQALDRLLRQMKIGKHRGLIFTQMTKMLDVLERFLNFHGYIYLRLDGATKVEQRQVLMERFNQDDKIFIFILSTRSGGVGVNLTGADTVIFYDSDWNPTMDAQAQDRCHRIGQTRDVHIYRLISDRTVEETILKKAQQKRMLCDMAIEGGNFTTAFFKEDSVHDLFNVSAIEEKSATADDVVVPTSNKRKTVSDEKEKKDGEINEEKSVEASKDAPKITNEQYEKALAETEEKDDVVAAERAKVEQDSELQEFNDNTGENAGNSKVEVALSMLEAELKPVERLALRFVERTNTYAVEDEVEETEKMLEGKKKEWELNHLQSLKEAEERKNAEEEDDMLFTYIRDDSYDQVNSPKKKSNKKRSSRGGSIASQNSDVDIDVTSPTTDANKGLRVNIQPLLMKLGDKKIEEIKKTAQQRIDHRIERIDLTKSSTTSSPRAKSRSRKPPPLGNQVAKKAIDKVNTGKLKTQSQSIEKTSISNTKLKALKTSIETNTNLRPVRQNSCTVIVGENSTNAKQSPSKRTRAVTIGDFISKTATLGNTQTNNTLTNSKNGLLSPKESHRTAAKTYTQTKLKLTPMSSGASSPSSLGSPDSLSSGDIRRSSRTPRPKLMDDDWVI